MKKKSLLKSILLSSMGVLVSSLIIVCLVFSINVDVQYTKSIKSDLYNTVAAQAEKMDGWFDKHVAIAEGFASAAVLEELHGDELQQYMLKVVHPCSSSIMNGYLAWETETVGMVCSIYPVAENYSAQSRGWYQDAKAAKKTLILDPYVDAITGKVVATVASPLLSESGAVLGVCGLDIEISELVSITTSLKVDAGGYAVLVDSADNIVAHAQNDSYSHRLDGQNEVVTKLTDIAPIYSEVLASAGSKNVVSGDGHDGQKRFLPIVPIGDTNWKIVYAANYRETMKPLTNVIVLAVIVSVAAIIWGVVYFYIKFTKRLRPLSGIERIVEDMSNGILDHNYPKATNDEIGTICHSLNTTNMALKSYISEIGRILAKMADGNFVYDSTVQFVGEFEAMEHSIRNICSSMEQTFEQLGSVSGQIANGSRSVSQGAVELEGAVHTEMRLISDVSDSLMDITDRVSRSSENAFEVKGRSLKATSNVNDGNRKMRELLEIMESIERSTTEIVKINSAIEDIAFQTNILALNASIEAARAGASGKGFAVVAEEVRNLASKSSEAASTTSGLIDQTVKKIESGTAAAKATAEMLTEIVSETNQINSAVSEIADFSEEQHSMLDVIRSKLGEVQEVIEKTAATAENSSAAGEALDSQVLVLEKSMERYK